MRDLPDKSGSIQVLRVAAEYIIEGRGAMFATVFGDTGTAKSLWAKIIVASLCRKGVQARYTRARAIEGSLFQTNRDDDTGKTSETIINRPKLDTLANVRALVIDEAHTVNWKNHWVSAGLQELLDMRYERANTDNPKIRQLTIFIAQHDPKDWAPDYLLDRMRQGSFAIPWQGESVPSCLSSRPCPVCGDEMKLDEKGSFLLCECGHDRDVEIFWPFKDMANSARPIMPAVELEGWN